MTLASGKDIPFSPELGERNVNDYYKGQCLLLGESLPIIETPNSNMSVISGHKAVLVCTFSSTKQDLSLSSSHQLIWIRQSYASHLADSILAHNQDLLISDSRFTVQRTDIDYSLTITNVNVDDEGIYACEVNTQPPQKASVHLYVQGKNEDSSTCPSSLF